MREISNVKLSNNYILDVKRQEQSENPNEDCCEDSYFLVHDHRQFFVEFGDVTATKVADYLNDNEDKSNTDYDKYRIYPVSAYIHSGVVLSLPKETGFDWSNRGFLLINKSFVHSKTEKEKEVYEEMLTAIAESTVAEWNYYLRGEVYEAIVNLEEYDKVSDTMELEYVDTFRSFYGEKKCFENILNFLEHEDTDKGRILYTKRKDEILKEHNI